MSACTGSQGRVLHDGRRAHTTPHRLSVQEAQTLGGARAAQQADVESEERRQPERAGGVLDAVLIGWTDAHCRARVCVRPFVLM